MTNNGHDSSMSFHASTQQPGSQAEQRVSAEDVPNRGNPRALREIAADLAEAILAQQKSRLSNRLDDTARLVRDATGNIDNAPQVSAYADAAAETLESVSKSIRQREVADYVDDVEQIIRQNPVGAAAGAALVGFALSRFLRSSRDEQRTSSAGGDA